MPSVEQPASLPDPPSQAEGPRAASSRDVSPCPTIRARPILQKVRYDGDEWFGLDYNMNLYRGCAHGCIYCDSRSECYRIDGFDQVRAKFDALSILRRELRSRRVRGIVGVGAMSDTYNPFDPTLPVRYRETYGERYFCNSPRAAPEPHPLPHPLQGTRPPLAHGRHHRRLQTRPPPGNASEPV